MIDDIIIKTKAKNICSIGNEEYTNNFRIFMNPSTDLPDYCEIDKFISNNIDGKIMIIEEAIHALISFIITTYHPYFVEIASHVTDASHSEVTVVKRWGRPQKLCQ